MPSRQTLRLLAATLLITSLLLGACRLGQTEATPTQAVPILAITLASGQATPGLAQTTLPTQLPLGFPTFTATPAQPTASLVTLTPFPTNTLVAVLPNIGVSTPTPHSVCSGAPETRLQVGLTAHVIPEPPIPNNVRQSPSTSSELVGLLQPGEAFKILDGPKCGDGLVYWYVESLETGLKGWTAEGDEDGYWLAAGEE